MTPSAAAVPTLRAVPEGRLATVSWWAVAAIVLVIVTAPRDSVGDGLGLKRFLTPEVSHEWVIGQRFRMDSRNLQAIEIQAEPVGAVAGSFVLTLRDLDAGGVVRTRQVAAADLVGSGSYMFRFPPIEQSAGHLFHFELAPAATSSGRGVALRATKGARLDEGGLLINDQPRWASLAFQTHTPAVSLLRAMVRGDDPDPAPKWLALVGLFGSWIALRFVFKAVAAMDAAVVESAERAENHIGPGGVGSAATTTMSTPDAPAAPPVAIR
jgi:hypothetical protein